MTPAVNQGPTTIMSGRAPPEIDIHLRPGIDTAASAAVFAQHGRVHIPQIFPEAVAARIERALRDETPWNRVFNSGDKHYDLGPDDWRAIPADKRAEIASAVQANGRTRFAYFFENFPVADLHAAGRSRDSFLMKVYEFANSPAFLAFARTVVGADDIVLADAQATCYRPGDFLTCHDDHVDGKQRRAAYVFNFTRPWSVDWGGILQFIDADGHVAEGYTPAFNALNIVRVPNPHSVSYVNPLAAGERYSITGWFRAG
jgi:Rps23 Pro-64 3,4-dihydroxylase Tpa1-like proline 4-hydroxylase